MTEPKTRQQRRRLEREQVKSGRALLAAGLAAKPTPEAMRDVGQALRAKLGERGNPGRAGDAAGLAQDLAETSLRRRPGATAIACRKGCSYCCYSFVGAVPPEVFRIVTAVRSGRAGSLTPDIIAAGAAPLEGVRPEARVGARLACPLLANGHCSVYADRPLNCRQATSLSIEACREEFEGVLGTSGRVEVSATHLAHAGNAHLALLGAMRAAGLSTDSYELSAAVTLALSMPDAERRWLDGEDIFAVLPGKVPLPADAERLVRLIAADIVG